MLYAANSGVETAAAGVRQQRLPDAAAARKHKPLRRGYVSDVRLPVRDPGAPAVGFLRLFMG